MEMCWSTWSIRLVYFKKASQEANSLDKTSIDSRKQLPMIQLYILKSSPGNETSQQNTLSYRRST